MVEVVVVTTNFKVHVLSSIRYRSGHTLSPLLKNRVSCCECYRKTNFHLARCDSNNQYYKCPPFSYKYIPRYVWRTHVCLINLIRFLGALLLADELRTFSDSSYSYSYELVPVLVRGVLVAKLKKSVALSSFCFDSSQKTTECAMCIS